MQTLADVLDMTVRVSASEQTCALGAAMFAATVSGIYADVRQAQEAMGKGFDMEFRPAPERVGLYQDRYEQYVRLGELIEAWQKRPAGGWMDARD